MSFYTVHASSLSGFRELLAQLLIELHISLTFSPYLEVVLYESSKTNDLTGLSRK